MRKNKLSILFLLLVFCLGFFLRFYRIRDLGTFRSDQAIELTHTWEILHGKLRLIGIKTSLSEVRNGAVMYYFLAPFLLLFNYDPVAGGVLQSLLSLATVLLTFYISYRYANIQVAFLSAFFISASPLLVSYSRQTLLAHYPLFFYCLSLTLVINILNTNKQIRAKSNQSLKGENLKMIFLGFLLGFMLQIHYATITTVFFVLAIFLFNHRLRRIKNFALLLIGVVFGFLPMIIFELRHQFFNSKMFFTFFEKSQTFTIDIYYLLGYWQTFSRQLFFGNQGDFFVDLALFIFLLLVIINLIKNKINKLQSIMILQFFCTYIFIIFFVKSGLVAHYALSSVIPFVVLFSSALDSLFIKKFKKRGYFLIFIFLIAFLIFNYQVYGLNDNHGQTMQSGWTVQGVEKAAKLITSDVDEKKKFNVVMVVDAENQGLPLRYFLKVLKKEPLDIDEYDSAEVLYVIAPREIVLESIKIWELQSFGAFYSQRTWHIQNGYLLYKLIKKISYASSN